MNFGRLDTVAFWVMRMMDPRARPLVFSGSHWAFGVRTGFPNYGEVWVMPKEKR